MVRLIWLLLLPLVSARPEGIPAGGGLLEKLEFSYEGCSNCPGFDDGKIRLDNLLVERLDRSHIALTGDLTLDTPIDENLMVTATISKCPSKTERGMCEDLPSNDIRDGCVKLPKKNESWSPFIDVLNGFNPHCPVKEGKYHFERYPVNLDQMSNMPVMEGYWIIKTEGFKENEKVMCMLTECEFKPPKGKKKKKVG